MLVDYPTLEDALRHAGQPAKQAPPGFERNAVCLLLFDRDETVALLILKADREGYPWRDQVALPGGRIDPNDRDAEDAVLRELHEELNIDRSTVEVLGSLGHFQTHGSDNDLEVIVARWVQQTTLHADQQEIARVLECPLSTLARLHVLAGFRSRSGSKIGDALVYQLSDARIWGVTARILHRFLEVALDRKVVVSS